MKRNDVWVPDFYQGTPLFSQIERSCRYFSQNDEWPELTDYQALLDSRQGIVRNGADIPLRFVSQSGKAGSWEEGYEPRIYLQGEIQTRLRNWHDYFQVMIWSTYPRAKVALNDIHFHQIQSRILQNRNTNTRGAIENALTIFDECGAIIVVRDNAYSDLIKSFRWKELFWERRNALLDNMQCYIFGHALYEKALHPYLGMTAHAILLQPDRTFFASDGETRQRMIDVLLAEFIYQGRIQSPRDLNPFPMLGMPGWWENNQASFYDNEAYFRPGRNHGSG